MGPPKVFLVFLVFFLAAEAALDRDACLAACTTKVCNCPPDQGPYPANTEVWVQPQTPIADSGAAAAAVEVAQFANQERKLLTEARNKQQRQEEGRLAQKMADIEEKENEERAKLAQERERIAVETRRLQQMKEEETLRHEEELKEKEEQLQHQLEAVVRQKELAAENERTRLVADAIARGKEHNAAMLKKAKADQEAGKSIAAKEAKLDAHLAALAQQRQEEIEAQRKKLEKDRAVLEKERQEFERMVQEKELEAQRISAMEDERHQRYMDEERRKIKEETEQVMMQEKELELREREQRKRKEAESFEEMKNRYKHEKEAELDLKYAKYLANPAASEYKSGYKQGYLAAHKNGHGAEAGAEDSAQQQDLYNAFLKGWDRSHNEVQEYATALKELAASTDTVTHPPAMPMGMMGGAPMMGGAGMPVPYAQPAGMGMGMGMAPAAPTMQMAFVTTGVATGDAAGADNSAGDDADADSNAQVEQLAFNAADAVLNKISSGHDKPRPFENSNFQYIAGWEIGRRTIAEELARLREIQQMHIAELEKRRAKAGPSVAQVAQSEAAAQERGRRALMEALKVKREADAARAQAWKQGWQASMDQLKAKAQKVALERHEHDVSLQEHKLEHELALLREHVLEESVRRKVMDELQEQHDEKFVEEELAKHERDEWAEVELRKHDIKELEKQLALDKIRTQVINDAHRQIAEEELAAEEHAAQMAQVEAETRVRVAEELRQKERDDRLAEARKEQHMLELAEQIEKDAAKKAALQVYEPTGAPCDKSKPTS